MKLSTRKTMQRVGIGCIFAALSFGGLTGCHSHFVQASVKNNSGAPISLLEVDYPSASFGADSLANGVTFHYRFKIIGSGPTKVLWTDLHYHNHSVTGPSLHEGQEGTLIITITGATATWQEALTTK